MNRHGPDLVMERGFTALDKAAARVLVVSNVLLYREGLSASLARDGRLEVVATLSEADLVSGLGALSADAVLIDASMEPALSVTRTLRTVHPHLRLVGFGISGAASAVVACAEAGIAAFVDRDSSVDDLVKAVQGALRGELSCSPRVAALLCDRLARVSQKRTKHEDQLTRREQEVASLISQGLSNKEIAKDLRIGPATVKNHVHNILDKLKVRRRSAIAACYSGSPGFGTAEARD